jgi:3-phenylpropionate/trans-cinnamate dioxygenase ferredoxin reductase component
MMSSASETFVIVGAGLAAAKAAETLRDEGFDGKVLLIGEEPERPYERPPLSKDYLRGEAPREQAYVHSDFFYGARDIDLVTGTSVTALDPGRARVRLDNGKELAYDRLLLATGAEPNRLSIPGADLEGIHYLRTMADCDLLRARLEGKERVVVIGAGWIGAEFAASARQAGSEVAVVEPASVPLERVLGTEVGAIYRDLHVEHGVELLCGTGVTAFEGADAVERVVTTDGRNLDCDFVLVGIGASPRVGLAEAAGLEVDNGVLVDQRLATSNPAIFAAGDAANAWHPFYERHVRVEHWANALNQGPLAAQAMLGRDVAYSRLPYFFSDQYDLGMEYSGLGSADDRVVFRGDPASREFIAFWLRDNRVVAGMNANIWDVTGSIQALIRSRQAVDVDALANAGTDLDSLLAAEVRSA